MRVAILFVRLVGLAMVLYGGFSLYMLHAMGSMMADFGVQSMGSSNTVQAQFQVPRLAWSIDYGMLSLGLVFTLFAARICTLLTFDYKG